MKSYKMHFVGIGGIGMSGIAEVFSVRSHIVSGSDLEATDVTRRLQTLGIQIYIGHQEHHVHGADVVVISSAVHPQNPEVQEARRLGIPVIPRAEMLAELMRNQTGIAVAGTHGKTTTTSMMAAVMTKAGLDPTVVIGGKVDFLEGSNARSGSGKFVVAEADESDGSFLCLPMTYCLVTNIDADHLDFYGSEKQIIKAFSDFLSHLPFYGFAMICGEDRNLKTLQPILSKKTRTYGFKPNMDWVAFDIQNQGMGSKFRAVQILKNQKTEDLGVFQLNVPGEHNVLNALGVLGLMRELGVGVEEIRDGLASFQGVKRRFEKKWESKKNQILLIDDYGHHPSEIQATLKAVRSFWRGRVITIFQPHRYSRTLHLYADFLNSFDLSDYVFLTDVYSAGEAEIKGVRSENLANELETRRAHKGSVFYKSDFESLQKSVISIVQPGDLILCMGAGSITKFCSSLIPECTERWGSE